MNFEDLKIRGRLIVAQLKRNAVDDSVIESVLNEGAKEVTRLVGVLKNNVKFNAEASVRQYNILNIDTMKDEFLELDKTRIYFRVNATSDYLPLIPKTREWFDEYYPNWLNNGDGTPIYYFREGRFIWFDTAPTSDVSDGFWVFYIKKPPTMTAPAHFPFGGEVELPWLESLSDTILLYFRWKTLPMLGKEDNYQLAEKAFYRDIKLKETVLNRRLDIKNDKRTKWQGPKVRCSF